ncbi:MAG TPA: hypothetical protein VLU25_07885 [Acidobacteriota bacterium]|nr:hypothetical protein [Acidobacteriota bacterium]
MIHKRNITTFILMTVGLMLVLAAQETLAQGDCCGDLEAFDLGPTLEFGCPGEPKITTDIQVKCKDAQGEVSFTHPNVKISATGQCQELPASCITSDYKECQPKQELEDTSTASQHSYEITVLNAVVDWDAENPNCAPPCQFPTGTTTVRNCQCATCPSGSGGGGGGGGECLFGDPGPDGTCTGSPILISVRGNRLELTDAEDGVYFDLDMDGFPERLAWTKAGTEDAFLALDRNNNSSIDDGGELFGNFTRQPPSTDPNGFLALAVYDSPEHGGNRDGKISANDAIFYDLTLWIDWNHNGYSEAGELRKVSSTRIQAFHLDYRESRRQDQHGNLFRFYSVVDMAERSPGPTRKFAVDVFFVREP